MMSAEGKRLTRDTQGRPKTHLFHCLLCGAGFEMPAWREMNCPHCGVLYSYVEDYALIPTPSQAKLWHKASMDAKAEADEMNRKFKRNPKEFG